ncbi:MAG: hypothetical protein PHQ43_14850 [Dehalococcoidales bacterium]|nr:hypothetical protein [Dehalococcoidales bacterium]
MNPKVEQSQDNLRCDLTDAELLDLGRLQARALSTKDQIQAEFETFKTSVKNRMAEQDALIGQVSEKIRNGYEFRYVPTTITTDFDANIVRFTRTDTGECYRQRPLNAEERQLKLEMEAKAQEVKEMEPPTPEPPKQEEAKVEELPEIPPDLDEESRKAIEAMSPTQRKVVLSPVPGRGKAKKG